MVKKGIAPLIATVLLVIFSVAVGFVVMSFGRAQIEVGADCPINVNFKMVQISGNDQICYDRLKEEIVFLVENGPNTEIKGLIINVIGTKRAETYNMDDVYIDVAANHMGFLRYNTEYFGNIRQIKITPKIKLFENEEICTLQSIIVEEVPSC
jgi:hypothetical protein